MDSAVLAALVAGVPGLIGSIFAYRQSNRAATKAAQVEAVRVEAGAYERARSLYEEGIRQLEEQVERLRVQINEERAVSAGLRRQVKELERVVGALRRQIINAGMELAPHALRDEENL